MRTQPTGVLVILALLANATLFAQEQVATTDDTAIKATQAATQTADWAKPWWMPRHKEKLAEKNTMKRVDLLMIGDSIMHGWEGGGKSVWDEHYAKSNALNIGFSGDRTEHVIWRLQNGEVDGISPKLAVIMIGTNNTGHRQDKPEDTAAGIKVILDELGKRLPDMKCLVLAIFPRGKDVQDPLRKINDRTNTIIKGFADNKRIFFLDINKEFLDADKTLSKSIMPDLLHPNEKGYRIWAKAMNPMVTQLMKDSVGG